MKNGNILLIYKKVEYNNINFIILLRKINLKWGMLAGINKM